MSEQTFQSLPHGPTEPRVKQENRSPLGHSLASEEKSASSHLTRRRRHSSTSPNNTTSSGKPTESTKQRRKAEKMPYRGQGGSSRGTGIMATTGLLNTAEEITFTPTTHRISKAKKGKKVHACEYPGCTKIFTRAEHRKRHEANHNTSPAFRCEIEKCRKPFQRADLLARHMERQHNLPSAEASAFRSQYRQSSTSDVSRSPRGSFGASQMGQPVTATAPSLPQTPGTMSIGSIIEPDMRSEFKSEYSSHAGSSIHELAHGPIGTAPRSLHSELLYGLAPSGDSPLYSSSDSCYSPLSGTSDYLQPPAVAQPYFSQDIVQRPQSTSIETCYQPIIQSPMSAGPATPAWTQFDPAALGFAPEAQCMPPQRQYQFPSPSWPGSNGLTSYEMSGHLQQSPWPSQYLSQSRHHTGHRYEITR